MVIIFVSIIGGLVVFGGICLFVHLWAEQKKIDQASEKLAKETKLFHTNQETPMGKDTKSVLIAYIGSKGHGFLSKPKNYK